MLRFMAAKTPAVRRMPGGDVRTETEEPIMPSAPSATNPSHHGGQATSARSEGPAAAPTRRLATLVWLAIVLALPVFATACGGKGANPKADSQANVIATATRTLVFELPSATPTPESTSEATGEVPAPAVSQFPIPQEDAKLVRMVIPAAKVNAPLQTKGVNARNEMENPDGKDNVAWYNFTTRPGFGANAVFSGHVDWYTGEKGVFWSLRDLKEGDEVVVRLSDGMELKYRVVSNVVYQAETAPVAEIVGETDNEAVTLITCEGVFNRGSQNYSDRRVVRAERIG